MQQKAIKLAKALIDELDKKDQSDTLSRWVAHYIGENLDIIESTTGQEKEEAEKKCFEAILSLWTVRNKLPDGLRPYEGFEPILKTLANLDPESPKSLYVFLDHHPKTEGENTETTNLLNLATQVDRVARILIDFALSEASAHATTPKVRVYLENAMPSEIKEDSRIIRILVDKGDGYSISPEEISEDLKKVRAEKIETLKNFEKLCHDLRQSLAPDVDSDS